MKDNKINKPFTMKDLELRIKSSYNNVSEDFETLKIKFKNKIRKLEKLEKLINDDITTIDKICHKNKFDTCNYNSIKDDNFTTVESANKENTDLLFTLEKLVKKKKKNFKEIVLNKSKNTNNRNTELKRLNLNGINLEQSISELTDEIKEKHQIEIKNKNKKMIEIAEIINTKIKKSKIKNNKKEEKIEKENPKIIYHDRIIDEGNNCLVF